MTVLQALAPAEVFASSDEVEVFRAAYPEITQIDALLADMNGVLRGKKMPVESLPRLYRDGIGFPSSIFALEISGGTVEETGLGFDDGDADRECRPIPGTLDPSPWMPRPTGQVLLSMRDFDGSPFFADPRTVLANIIDRLAADGLTPVAAVELEFYLFDRERETNGAPRPPRSPMTGRRPTTPQVYGIGELDDFDGLLHEIAQACRMQRVPVDCAVAEYAPGQYEINLHHHADALIACDDALLFKRVVKGVALKHGVQASFMAKPYANQPGSGLHIHLSMLDRDGTPLFAAERPDGTPALRHAIGGLAATMAEGMALFAQNQNAFRRFQPNSYAPHAPVWAVNNRSAALRIPAGPPADRRIEHRVAGADANVYLVMAAVLAGAHYGITRQIDPGPPVRGNAYAQVKPTLTSSWTHALDLLDGSAFYAEYFGRRFIDVYLAVKRAEHDRFFSMITPLEYEWYLDRA